MMGTFEFVVDSDLTPELAWQAVTDWPAHAEHVPLTAIERTADGFVARTGIGTGRFGFEDPMRVEAFIAPVGTAPGECRIIKLGRVVRGEATLTVHPLQDGSRVRWRETADVGPRFAQPLLAPASTVAGRLLFGRVLVALLRRGGASWTRRDWERGC
jgi:carbon monoxide dehydrogenase subunit G